MKQTLNTVGKIAFATAIGIGVIGLVACTSTPTQESTGQYIDSSTVTAKVKAALLNTQGLNSTAISVQTYKGTVQLSGFVDNAADVQTASQTAAKVAGVQQVINNLVAKTAANS